VTHIAGPDGGTDARVDELRRHLKELGYLDAGVDRFVLGPARAQRPPALIALLASLRIGLIAAVLLGPAAAIGIGARIPGFITGSRDAIVLAVYVGVLLGTAVTIAAFAAGMLLDAASGVLAGRRARLLALGAGALVAAACLTYLTLWWRVANAGPDWSAPVWTAFALIVAVAISLLLGHAVAVMASAVVMARIPDDEGAEMAASALFSVKLSVVAGTLAFAGAAALLVLTAPSESRGTPGSPPLTVVSSGLRVRLIAIDGFDPATFEALAHEGGLPALGAALGGSRATLAPHDTGDPARAWTTIATGHPAEVHGVHGLETRRVTGVQGSVPLGAPAGAVRALQAATDLLRLTRPSLVSGDERRVKTFWEVAADSGLRTTVVNWWTTWPAPAQGTATVLSDRAALRLELGGALDAEIAPAALYERLRSEWPAIRRAAAARARPPAAPADAAIADILQRSSELDALQVTLAGRVMGGETDLLAVYLPGLDIAQHAFFGERTAPLAPSAVAARLDALREYYRFLDRLLADLLTPAANELVFVVTGPGRVAERGPGMLAARGAAARAGARVGAQVTDVMPTIVYALGLPRSRELPGRPLQELFTEQHVARYPVRDVGTYGRPAVLTAPRSGQPLDEEMIERLRSLGYVR
jgi:hypothetical protein